MSDTPTPIAEIDHGPSKFDQFLENNQKKLVILALIIFLSVIAYVFFKGYNTMQNERAGALLSEANTEEQYNQVISEYPAKIAAGTAAYSIATMRTSDEDAIEAYNHFISTYPQHPLLALAEFNLAQRQINAGKSEEATATLQALIDRENVDFITPKAKIALGDIALANGEKQNAENLYNEAINFNESKHPFAAEAKAKISYITASAPAMVDAPKTTQPAESTQSTPIEEIKPLQTAVEEARLLELSTPITPAEDLLPETPAQPQSPSN